MQPEWGMATAPLRDPWPHEARPPERLPVVLAARADGWCLLPEVPMWSFLPSVWPAAARAWVPDRSVRVIRMTCDGRAEVTIPWSAWDHMEMEQNLNDMLGSAGVPPRPFARLWLLRPPPSFVDLESVLDELEAQIDVRGLPRMCCAEIVQWAGSTIREWFTNSGTDLGR